MKNNMTLKPFPENIWIRDKKQKQEGT